MRYEVIDIKTGVESRSDYQATLTAYILNEKCKDAGIKRPAVIICPGGGYVMTSEREAEPVAMHYLAGGCHAFILRYSCAPAVFPTAMLELAKAVQIVREHADEWHVDENKIIVSGFSAGGHLAASLSVFWDRDFVREALGVPNELIKPNGSILCYPVITSGKFAHRGSFSNVLAEKEHDEDLLELLSLEKQVSESTPPTFLWHTWTDGSVPVENSLFYVQALKEKGVSAEIHIYPNGGHGISLANEETSTNDAAHIIPECQNWIKKAVDWVNRL